MSQYDLSLLRCIAHSDPLKFQPKRVILIGNGAMENGWEPAKVLLEGAPSWTRAFPELNESLISQELGRMVFLYHASRDLLLRPTTSEDGRKICIEKINGIKERIGDLAAAYEKSPPYFRKYIDKIEQRVDIDTAVVSLNWDMTGWNRHRGTTAAFPNLVHLHGRCSDPGSMILPLEMTATDDLQDFLHFLKDADKVRENIERDTAAVIGEEGIACLMRRDPGSTSRLTSAHKVAISWLEAAREVVVWGLAFNPSDAEISTVLNAVAKSRTVEYERLVVINPDPRNRLIAAAILHTNLENVEWIDPTITINGAQP